MFFDRNRRLGADDGRPITLNGQQSFVTEGLDGPNDCTIRAEHRQYVNLDGEPSTELLGMQVTGARPMNELCDTAKTLMTAALQDLAKQLPAR